MEQIQETQNLPQSPVEPLPESALQTKSRKPLFIIVSLLLLLIIVTGAVYAGMKLQEKKQTPTQIAKITPTVTQEAPTAVPTTDPTMGWKTYTNSNFAYSYKYPSDWQVFTNKFNTNNSLFGPDAKSDSGLGGVEVNKYSGLIDDYMNGVETQYSGKKEVKIGEISGIRVNYNSKSTNISGTSVFFKKGEFLINIYINSQLPSDIKIFEQITSTFKFLGSGQTDATAGWKTYTNQNFNFSFKYPENFMILSDKIKANSDLTDVFNGLTLIKSINKDNGQPPQITLFIYDTPKTVQEYTQTDLSNQLIDWEAEKQRLGNDLVKPTMSSFMDVSGSIISAKKVEGTRIDTAPNPKYVWYLFKKNNLLFRFSVSYGTYNPDTKEDGSNEKAILDQILSTFKFLD